MRQVRIEEKGVKLHSKSHEKLLAVLEASDSEKEKLRFLVITMTLNLIKSKRKVHMSMRIVKNFFFIASSVLLKNIFFKKDYNRKMLKHNHVTALHSFKY